MSTSTPETDRAFGLLLFEAEESLARGAPDRSLVLASKAVKERPESLTARSLMERARRELLQGRRREKLEARVAQARALLESGDQRAAEKIVTSALKLMPDHPVALELFGRLRDLRLQAGNAEAEAERELQKLAWQQAQKAAEAARGALRAGWNRQALFHLRRGLRQVPDHPDLLALLREAQSALEELGAERTRRRAQLAQVRAGLDLLARGELEASLRMLRAVLLEDPENARAQAAVQEVRHAWLRKGAPPPPSLPGPTAAPPRAPRPAPAVREAHLAGPSMPGRRTREPRVPVEILLPLTRRRATPIGLILGCALLLIGILVVIAGRSGRVPEASTPSTPSTVAIPPPTVPGPLASVDPGLRSVVETALADYGRALERADADLLARARPDLTAAERARLVAPFVGALNAAADIRVIDVTASGNDAAITILSTYVIVGNRQGPTAPVEETLRFSRRGDTWELRARREGSP
jgi:tetratricopeptide (TPR) repeat protein